MHEPDNHQLELLAYDIAKLLDRTGFPCEATSDDIRPELPDFIARITANATRNAADQWETAADAARWNPDLDTDSAEPTAHTDPPPAIPWLPTQGIELGHVGPHEHYWRCPICRTHVGPYTDVMACKTVGMEHRFITHDQPSERWSDARKAARRIGGPRMTAATFDAMIARIANAHTQPASTIHLIVSRIADLVAGYGQADDLVAAIVRDGLTHSTEQTRHLVLDLAGGLGNADQLIRMGL